MKLFKRANLPTISALALAGALVIILSSCRTRGTNSTAASTPVPYPLGTCVVSGDKLADMGEPIVFIYSNNAVNQEIKFCCADCKPKFLEDPDKYMNIIRDAEGARENQNTKN